MKLGCITDLHLGNHARWGTGPLVNGLNIRCRDVFATVERAVTRAKADGCTTMLVAGDVFDYDRVEPAVEAALQQLIQRSEMNWQFIVGNHDQTSGEQNHNALAPLKSVATVHEQPARCNWYGGSTAAVFAIPFRSGRAEEWLESAMLDAGVAAAGSGGRRAMMIHLGVSDTSTPYFLDGANDSISVGTLRTLMTKYDIQHTFAGNWHCQRRWAWTDSKSRTVTQVGTLAPVRFSDGGLLGFGGLAVYDTDADTINLVEIPGPRWLTLDFAALEEVLWEATHQDPMAPYTRFDHCAPLYIAAKVCPDEQEMTRGVLDLLVKKGFVRAGEVTVQAEVVRANATAIIRTATNPASRIEAIQNFVNTAPIPPDVNREEVREFVLECVKGVI